MLMVGIGAGDGAALLSFRGHFSCSSGPPCVSVPCVESHPPQASDLGQVTDLAPCLPTSETAPNSSLCSPKKFVLFAKNCSAVVTQHPFNQKPAGHGTFPFSEFTVEQVRWSMVSLTKALAQIQGKGVTWSKGSPTT